MSLGSAYVGPPEFWRAVVEAFGAHKPAGTLIGVTVLAHDGQLVEIEAIAAIPQS